MRRNTYRGGRRGGTDGPLLQGPLMTDHLEDLDLELQLLKRKRQMIEQQHQGMLGRQGQRSYMYDQPQAYNQQPYEYKERQGYDPPSRYSQSCDIPTNTTYSNNSGNQFGRKRQFESPWDYDEQPKRFSGPKGKNSKKPFDDRPGRSNDPKPEPIFFRRPPPSGRPSRAPTNLQSLMSLKPKPLIGQLNKQNQPRISQSSKVTKPKPATTNKIGSYPVADRKKLVAKASNLVSIDESILSLDRVPSQQMTGRLELALGNILKDLKQAYGTVQPHAASFQSSFMQRAMKQLIRERIRSVMLGKVVGSVVDILRDYRKVFPISTDRDILQAALDAREKIESKKVNIKLVDAEDPGTYFYINMQKLIDVTLNEMFSKLHTLYEKSGESVTEDVSQNKGSEANDTSTADTSKVDDTKDHADNATSEIVVNNASEKTSQNDTSKDVEIITDNDIGPTSETTENVTNNVDETTTENVTNNSLETSTENVTNKADEITTISNDSKDLEGTINDNSTLEDDVKAKVDTDAAKPAGRSIKVPNPRSYKKFQVFQANTPESKTCEQFIELTIKRSMPNMLRKHIPDIIKLLNLDDMYKTASAAITKKSLARAGLHVKDDSKVATEGEVQQASPGPLRHFVKVIARPFLPKRKLMQNFLNQFNPKSIKKHKRIQSLLFVGFSNKEDFDNILAASGTAIGNSTLEIKVSEKLNDQQESNEEPEVKGEETNNDVMVIKDDDVMVIKDDDTNNDVIEIKEASFDSLIGAELDEKIDDLLSSIRKAEEKNKEGTSDGTKPVEIDGDKKETEEVSPNKNTTAPEKQNDKVDNNETGEQQNETETQGVAVNEEKPLESAEINKTQQSTTNNVNKELDVIDENDKVVNKVEALKNDAKESGRATPTRSSSRLANFTPSTIRTRRSSKLAQNNP